MKWKERERKRKKYIYMARQGMESFVAVEKRKCSLYVYCFVIIVIILICVMIIVILFSSILFYYLSMDKYVFFFFFILFLKFDNVLIRLFQKKRDGLINELLYILYEM